MALDTKLVGSSERLVVLSGDPADAANLGSTLSVTADRNLAGKYAPVVQGVGLLLAPDNNYDPALSAQGAPGVPSVSTEGVKTTYSAGVIGYTPAATATDFLAIVGSATKTVRVTRVSVSGIATAAATVEIQLIKRSTDNTGGTSANETVGPHDSNDAAATALVRKYSANPSALGTSVGVTRAAKLNLGAAGAAGSIAWTFSDRNSKGIVLRGVAQLLSLNWGGAAVPAGTSLCMEVEFTEET